MGGGEGENNVGVALLIFKMHMEPVSLCEPLSHVEEKSYRAPCTNLQMKSSLSGYVQGSQALQLPGESQRKIQ